MKLVKLQDYTEDKKALVKIIEHAKQQAESGEITSAMILTITPDGAYFASWAGMAGYDNLTKIGMLEVLKREAMEDELEEDEE